MLVKEIRGDLVVFDPVTVEDTAPTKPQLRLAFRRHVRSVTVGRRTHRGEGGSSDVSRLQADTERTTAERSRNGYGMNSDTLTVALIGEVFFDPDGGVRLSVRFAEAKSRGAGLAVLPELAFDSWVLVT
jgi:hypothetical protein